MQNASLTKTGPGFYTWSFFHPEVKTECASHVFVHDQSLIFIDPFPVEGALEAEINRLGSPTAILLTNANHKRAVLQAKKQFNVPVGAGAEAIGELGFIPEVIVDSLVQIHSLKPISLKGAGAGEFAYHCPKNKTLVVGDALVNTEKDGLVILPEKYCTDARLLKTSLAKLLDLDFDNLLVAHGRPVLGGARAKISALLKS